jgi:hypothetical protein
MSGFTCTASSCFANTGLYTGTPANVLNNTRNGWGTQRGKAQNAWITVNFNNTIKLSEVKLQQTSSIVDEMFKEVQLSFSNGQSHKMGLPKKRAAWSSVKMSPLVDTNFVTITALEYHSPENLQKSRYGLCQVQFYGSIHSQNFKY